MTKTGAVMLADVIERADIRMLERRDRPPFAFEAGARLGVAGQLWRQDFYRDRAIEPCISRAIHLAHAAGTDKGDDFVGAEAATGLKSQCLFRDGTAVFYAEARPNRLYSAPRFPLTSV